MNFLLRSLFSGIRLDLQSDSVPSGNDLPPLQPPHGSLPPTFWERDGWGVLIAALLILALLVLLILWLRRPLPEAIVPPDALARRDLEALRRRKEDGMLLTKVSGILRRYVIFACGLPPGEMTTAELCRAVAVNALFTPGLAASTADFFRQCDERKFSPAPPASELGAVATAIALVEKIEQCRRQPSIPPIIPVSQSAAGSPP